MVTAKRVAVDLAFDSGPANDVWIRAAGSLRFYMFVPYRPNVLSLSRHVPSLSGSATRRVAQNEARKRRANERHVVGCCEELCRGACQRQPDQPIFRTIKSATRCFICAYNAGPTIASLAA